ncbi:hypothetical protein [Vibrio algarum]|uniref:Uncharacterized protein n=1 Tax=Vibrio algarum TaxID=3020714 RepID=A0ABT4YV10_9VIBR|nr:hypothetical protein [Vibrio sp. KJ40-1]MDB1125386.1 hypothetical protein [Vibrio sp. KJ40-1]
MTDSIMSKLKQQLEIAGLDTLHLSDKETLLFARAIEEKAAVFEEICLNSPEKKPKLLLLGLLTKLQIEATARLDAQADKIGLMQNIFSDTLGQSQADKFSADSVIELSLITKLWLMVQGYLNMDFSLANDYALNAATLLAKALHSHDVDEIRTELLASYYHGKHKRKGDEPSILWSNKIISWFTKSH